MSSLAAEGSGERSPTEAEQVAAARRGSHWKLFASKGHTTLEILKVLSQSEPIYQAIFWIFGGILFWIAAIVATGMAQAKLVDFVDAIGRKVAHVIIDVGSDAPSLRPISINTQLTQDQIATLTSTEDAVVWINQTVELLNTTPGAKPQYCNLDQKVTSNWYFGDGTQPACRIGKENIWVWALTKTGSDGYAVAQPLLGVFHKSAAVGGAHGAWNFLTLDEAQVRYRGITSTSLSKVARAAAKDMPELKEGDQ